MQFDSWRVSVMLERDTSALTNRAPMSTSTVVLVAPPAVACANPAVTCYGGVERVVWRLTRLLTLLGAEVVPVASGSMYAKAAGRSWPAGTPA